MKKLNFLFSILAITVLASAIGLAFHPVLGAFAFVGLMFSGSSEKGVLSANGFRPYVLQHLKSIALDAAPQLKLEPHGFLAMLQKFKRPQLMLNTNGGHKNTVQVKYLQRFTKDFTDTSKSCDNTNQMAYAEVAVSLSSTRQIAIHIPDETIAQYEDDASRTVMMGQPATDFMNEFMEQVVAASNAIMDGVNSDLLTVMSSSFGVNRRTGSTSAATINIDADNTVNTLSNGITQLLADYQTNGGKGRPQIVGSGLFHNYTLQQPWKSYDGVGLNTAIAAGAYDFYHDLNASTILGANQIGVFEPNSVGLVEYMEYTGFKAGVKPGGSTFGTLALPMVGVDGNNLPVEFDFQLRYNDCAETVTDAYYGTELTLEKGYNLIISKQCGLFTIPSGAYRATDVLNGNRGTLRYTITNS